MTNFHDAAEAANDDVRALDAALIDVMAEAVIASPDPSHSAFALFGAAVGILRSIVGDDLAAAALFQKARALHG